MDYATDGGIFEAYHNVRSAWQAESGSEGASLFLKGEDCLCLSIRKADDRSCERKPVMVWIHGGGLMTGGTVDPCTGAMSS